MQAWPDDAGRDTAKIVGADAHRLVMIRCSHPLIPAFRRLASPVKRRSVARIRYFSRFRFTSATGRANLPVYVSFTPAVATCRDHTFAQEHPTFNSSRGHRMIKYPYEVRGAV